MSEQQQNSGEKQNSIPQMTRRQALQTVLATGGVLAAGDVLAACGGTTTQSAPSLTPTPRNQTVVIDAGEFTVYDSFNRMIPNGQEYDAGFSQICEEFLFYYNLATGKVVPWQGESWSYNADHTQMTLKLNPKVHWSDGVALTAKDVKFTIDMLRNNATLSGHDTYSPEVTDVVVQDDQTVVFHLNQSDARFHYNFVCGILWSQSIMPEHIWSKQDPTTFKNNPPIFTGPYVLDRAIEAQKMYIWKKDPNYWNKAAMDPRPGYVVYRTAPTADSEIQEFKRGQVDLLSSSVDYTQATAIKNGGYANIVIETKFRDPNPRALVVNCDPARGIIADPKLHWAISYLVDRNLMATTVSSVPTIPAQYPWADYASNAKWNNPTLAAKYALTYDPAKAASLLDELGAKKGSDGKRTYNGQALQYEIITSTPQGQPEYVYGEKLADELTKIGIPSTIRYYSSSVFGNKFYTGLYDIAVWPVQGFVFDPAPTYNVFEIRNTKALGQDASMLGNYSRAQFKDLDSVALQMETADPATPEFKVLADQALELFYKYLPFIPVYQQTYPSVFNTTYWTNWPSNDNLYTVPTNWWGQFLFVLGNLKPTGAS